MKYKWHYKVELKSESTGDVVEAHAFTCAYQTVGMAVVEEREMTPEGDLRLNPIFLRRGKPVEVPA